jgi:peptide/nickel transport system permease protein
MLGFVIQRLLQAVLVMLAMSALVFVGVYAIGNPIDVLISPDATQDIRAEAIARYGLDLPLWEQYLAFLGRLLQRRFRALLRLRHAGASTWCCRACRRRSN